MRAGSPKGEGAFDLAEGRMGVAQKTCSDPDRPHHPSAKLRGATIR
jgi:hypothetical protein